MKKINMLLLIFIMLIYFKQNYAIFGIVNATLETADVLSFGAVTTADRIINTILPVGLYRPYCCNQ